MFATFSSFVTLVQAKFITIKFLAPSSMSQVAMSGVSVSGLPGAHPLGSILGTPKFSETVSSIVREVCGPARGVYVFIITVICARAVHVASHSGALCTTHKYTNLAVEALCWNGLHSLDRTRRRTAG